MNIVKDLNGTTLTIALEGRLDTTTAPAANKELETLGNVETIIWDFEKLTYISSAGIRVLLIAQKAMNRKGGSMKVINSNEDVKEVFDVTGCYEVFTIE
ncbi:MAG: STAS domain-containing protein [Clostridia bacterium]|nr:STAS domain-containing protein [Clostridia bacterium]MBQ6558018.1 STAS domain-containing protein [Clostridia bacterium]MBR0028603.1 STAS domain-containing protein [Clostridia bacterium]MBR0469988.1 STAS domain-containing protein [Clostridia bacterium]